MGSNEKKPWCYLNVNDHIPTVMLNIKTKVLAKSERTFQCINIDQLQKILKHL